MNYKNGSYTYRERALHQHGCTCARCHKRFPTAKLVVHHKTKDYDRWQAHKYGSETHRTSNLKVYCKPCHAKLHGFDFEVRHNVDD